MKTERTPLQAGKFTQIHSHILKDFMDAPEAGFALINILSHKDEYIKTIKQLCKLLGMSPEKWRKIRTILIEKGYYNETRSRDKSGVWNFEYNFSDKPKEEWKVERSERFKSKKKKTIPPQPKDSVFTKEEWNELYINK